MAVNFASLTAAGGGGGLYVSYDENFSQKYIQHDLNVNARLCRYASRFIVDICGALLASPLTSLVSALSSALSAAVGTRNVKGQFRKQD